MQLVTRLQHSLYRPTLSPHQSNLHLLSSLISRYRPSTFLMFWTDNPCRLSTPIPKKDEEESRKAWRRQFNSWGLHTCGDINSDKDTNNIWCRLPFMKHNYQTIPNYQTITCSLIQRVRQLEIMIVHSLVTVPLKRVQAHECFDLFVLAI